MLFMRKKLKEVHFLQLFIIYQGSRQTVLILRTASFRQHYSSKRASSSFLVRYRSAPYKNAAKAAAAKTSAKIVFNTFFILFSPLTYVQGSQTVLSSFQYIFWRQPPLEYVPKVHLLYMFLPKKANRISSPVCHSPVGQQPCLFAQAYRYIPPEICVPYSEMLFPLPRYSSLWKTLRI